MFCASLQNKYHELTSDIVDFAASPSPQMSYSPKCSHIEKNVVEKGHGQGDKHVEDNPVEQAS